MKFLPAMLLPLCAALCAATATAQLKMPRVAPMPAVPAASAPAPVAAPSPETVDKEAAGQLAAQGWLLLLDRRDWGRAWETSGALFRSTVPLANWMDAVPKLRDEFGAFVERTPIDAIYKTSLRGRPDGEYVTAIFRSKFESREVQEILTVVREPDGKWRVTGYSTQ